MQVGKRLFPYPVLNNDVAHSSYKNSSYSLIYDHPEDISGNKYIFKNVRYILNNDEISSLIDKGLAEAVCVIESSKTLYRKVFKITENPIDISINISNLNGEVTISSYIYAKDKIDDFHDDDFLEEYSDFKFTIYKHDIIAVDDGYKFKMEYPESEDNKMSSIFLVIPDLEINDESMSINLTNKKIYIKLDKKSFEIYENIKDSEYYKNIFFSVLAIPALVYAIDEVKGRDVEDLCFDTSWFNTIYKSYQRIYNKPLTNDEFININSIELAQALMNMPVSKSISDLYDIATSPIGGSEDEE